MSNSVEIQTTKGRLLPSSTSAMGRYTLQRASMYLWPVDRISEGYDPRLLFGFDGSAVHCASEGIPSAYPLPNQHCI